METNNNNTQTKTQGFFAEPRAYLSKDGEYLTLVLPGNMLIRKHVNFQEVIRPIEERTMNQNKYFETELKPRLEKLSYKKSKAFCYSCYTEAPTGVCALCGSDDLARIMDGIGVEFGIAWVIQHLIESNLIPINTEAAFQEFINECYPATTKVLWLELDSVTIAKEIDPISWEMAKSEFVDSQIDEGFYVTFDDGKYFSTDDVETFLNHEGVK